MLTPRRFGLELAPEVVQADGNVRNLAWRTCNAKRVLVCSPHFSPSSSIWSLSKSILMVDPLPGPLQHVEIERCNNPNRGQRVNRILQVFSLDILRSAFLPFCFFLNVLTYLPFFTYAENEPRQSAVDLYIIPPLFFLSVLCCCYVFLFLFLVRPAVRRN